MQPMMEKRAHFKSSPYRMPILLFLLCIFLVGCVPDTGETPAAVGSVIPPTAVFEDQVQRPGWVEGDIQRFGWTDKNDLWYAVQDNDHLQWYLIDPKTTEAEPWEGPGPEETILDRIRSADGVEILQAVISPSGEKIVYQRLPEGYQPPSFETPIPDYAPDWELWLTQDNGATTTRIDKLCGELDPELIWLEAETKIFGSCHPAMGIPTIHFLTDLETRITHQLTFKDSLSGELSYPAEARISPDGQELIFSDVTGQFLYLTPFEALVDLNTQSLGFEYRVPVTNIIHSPRWSAKDQGILYWRSPRYGPDSDSYDQELMRIDPNGGLEEVILGREGLIDQIGWVNYQTLSNRFGVMPDWELSPNGKYAALRIIDSASTVPGLVLLELEN
jgi:hypothetical protein